MSIKKLLSFLLVLTIGVSLVACTEEINKEERTVKTSPNITNTNSSDNSSHIGDESVREQSPNEEVSDASTTVPDQATDSIEEIIMITQPSDMDMANIARYAHERDGLDVLYPINPQSNLKAGCFRYIGFSEQDIETIKSSLPDNYQISKDDRFVAMQGEKGDLFFSNGDSFSYSRASWQGDQYGEHGYKATINILGSSYVSYRRVLTAPQNENLSFMPLSDVKQMAENFFASIGLGPLILRSSYAVREAETGKPFYYLEFMQLLEGIPLVDESGIPFFPGVDMSGVYNAICCAIDEEGFAYISASKGDLVEASEAISIISREEMVDIVNKQLDSVIDNAGETFKIDSVELLWGSDEARTFGEDAPQDYRLVPYYLVVLRSTGPDPLGADHGDRFRRWIYDAQTGLKVQ